MIKILLIAGFSALTALLVVKWIYFKILRIALTKNIVDNPNARKLQKRPIPILGGVAVFAGTIAGTLAGAALTIALDLEPTTSLLPIICGMTLMLYAGALDDIVGLSPRARIVMEVLVMLGLIYAGGGCIDSFHGLWGVRTFSWWVGVPLTVFAGVGVINAFNMIDGVNGLSSGLCILCCLLFGFTFIHSSDYSNALLAFSMAAALIPFFAHNVFGLYSRMFIGDAGTMVMGVLMIWFTICILSKDSSVVYYAQATNLNLVALVLAIQSVPVFDTLRVMTLRMLHGESPFHPDKTHLHHAFVRVGVSHSITTLSILLIDVTVTVLWALSVLLKVCYDGQLYVVIASAMILVWGTYALLKYNSSRHTAFLHRLVHFSIATHLGRKNWWKAITRYLDKDTYREKEEIWKSDRELVLEFLKGKAEVFVEDIREHSGADAEKVNVILQNAKENGEIQIIRENNWGLPEIVCME